MSSVVDTVLAVGKSLFGLRMDLAKARQERKDTVAEYLAGIAQTLEDTGGALRQGQFPHGRCQELFVHGQNMTAAIGDLVGERRALELQAQLMEVWDIERLFGELSSADDDQRTRSLDTLDLAAGTFRATAAFVRVSP